mgnify:FL=1
MAIAINACTSFVKKNNQAMMGTETDNQYAKKLWSVMEKEKLVGVQAKPLKPFFGGAKPHGMILEIANQTLNINGHTGFLVVKKNYGGKGVSVESVKKNRSKYLSSITVMYQRKAGYDVDNQDWFWVKYQPNGQFYYKNINQVKTALTGRVIKGKTDDDARGCIYCHRSAGGGDYIFYPEILKP